MKTRVVTAIALVSPVIPVLTVTLVLALHTAVCTGAVESDPTVTPIATATDTAATAADTAVTATEAEGRGHVKNMMMNPYMLIPQLITLGFAPIVLANLKMMVMSALMINNMALNAAIFMLVRNLVFGPRPIKKYVNYGYRKPHHHHGHHQRYGGVGDRHTHHYGGDSDDHHAHHHDGGDGGDGGDHHDRQTEQHPSESQLQQLSPSYETQTPDRRKRTTVT